MINYDSGTINQIVSINDVSPKGVTLPLICSLDTGDEVVVKYPKNYFGTIVLVREWIGARVAEALEIKIPDYGLAYLPEDVIDEAAFFIEGLALSVENSGVCFYSKMLRATPLQYERLRNNNDVGIASIVLYDYMLNNCDRHDGNVLITLSGEVYCIDNSHIIVDKNDRSSDVTKYLEPSNVNSIEFYLTNIERYNLLMGNVSDEYLLGQAKLYKMRITKSLLESIKQSIPDEWVDSIGEGIIDSYLQIISSKASNIVNATKKIMDCRKEQGNDK